MENEKNQKIKLVVFDLGGVIFMHSFDVALRYWSEKARVEFDDLKMKFSHDHMYALHEVDRISIEEYKNHVCRELGMEISLEDFIVGWNSIFLDEVPGASEVLDILKQDYSVVALSNTNRTHCDFLRQKYAKVLAKFGKVFFSHEILERKPNRRAYERVMSEFEVTNSEVVFLDDLSENIDGAKAVGIHTIHVKNHSAMVGGLEELGLL